MLSLAAALALTVASAVAGLNAFLQVGSALEETVDTDLPTLISAMKLAQRSEAAAVNAAMLVNAALHSARQSALHRLLAQQQRVAELVEQLRGKTKLDPTLLRGIEAETRAIERATATINEAALRRIVDTTLYAQVLDETRHVYSDSTDPALSRLMALAERLDDLDHPAQLAQAQEHIRLAIESAQTEADQRVQQHLARLVGLIDGPDGLLALRGRVMRAEASLQGLQQQHATASLRLTFAIDELVQSIQGHLDAISAESADMLDRQSRILIWMLLCTALGITAAVFYVSRGLLARISDLQRAVEAGARGGDFDLAGTPNDELGDMARAVTQFITSRDQAEAALRESEQRFRDVAEAASEWLWETSPVLEFTFFSGDERLRRMLQAALLDGAAAAIAAAAAAAQPFRNIRIDLKPFGGDPNVVTLSGKPILAPDGRLLGYRGTGLDISEAVEAEMRAAVAQRRLADAVENIPEGFILWDPNGRVLVANGQFRRLFPPSLPPSSLLPASMPDDRQVEIQHKGRWLQIRRHNMTDGSVVGVFTDITEVKSREEELRDAMEAAEEANLEKTRFLAAASHDLRQPLQALAMFAAALSQRSLSEADQRLVGKMEASIESLGNLFEALLDISRLDAGVVEAVPNTFAVSALLERLQADFAPLADKKQLSLRVRRCDQLVHTDQPLLERILRNLLTNAVRYTDRGGVLLGARRRGAMLRIEVWDSGPGIAPEQQQQIFREFVRLDEGARGGQGLGLGLAIVERTSALLGLHLDLRSIPGKGSAFSVDVPLSHGTLPPSHGPRPEAVAYDFSGAVLLLIEDEADVREAMTMMLETWGADVVSVESAEEAIEQLRGRGTPPDAIIADYRLRQGKTGGEALDALRSWFDSDIPAIIVTGDTAPERLIQAHQHNAPVLHKPVSPEKLREVINNMIYTRSKRAKLEAIESLNN